MVSPVPVPRGAAASRLAATRIMTASPRAGASTCTPTGRPSEFKANGTLAAGWPARLDGMEHRSHMYIWIGSSTLEPKGKATDGVVGVNKTSKFL